MARGIEPSDDDSIRDRASSEHDDRRETLESEPQEGNRIGTPALSSEDGPVAEASENDVQASAAEEHTGLPEAHSSDGDSRRSISSGKKRRSDEITRDQESAQSLEPPSLSIDIHATPMANESTTSLSQGNVSPNTMPSPRYSPLSARTRTRGMSLRSSLFARNIDRRSPTEDTIIELDRIGQIDQGSDRQHTSEKIPQASVTVSPVKEGYQPAEDPSFAELHLVSSWNRFRGASALPNYQHWVQEQAHRHLPIQPIKNLYRRSRKFVLRIKDIPPSKDGRHIAVDPSKRKPLTDERTGQPFIDNYIRSSKYTLWNFLPRQLFAQFSKLANFYFLIVSILQMIPGLSTTGTYTTIVPLMFFVSISMAKEGYEDFRRHRLDKTENRREAKVLHAGRSPQRTSKNKAEVAADEQQDRGSTHWAPVKWEVLRVGDIVKLERDEAVPADVVLLDSKGAKNLAYIETMALDGETNLKTKQPSVALTGKCRTPEDITTLDNTEVVVEDPNLDLYNFEGRITVGDADPAPLTNNEIIYRGSILRNTPEIIGMVIYSGEECKMRMNANKNPRIKAPTLQSIVNKIVIMMVVFVVALSLFNTIAYQIWADSDTSESAWYLEEAAVAFGHSLAGFIIMFNTLIPLSLYVSLEIIKLGQMYFLNDIDMYDEASNTPFEARTSTINEELGQVSYIFSDKTGTLTENIMRFRKLSVAGMACLHDVGVQGSEGEDGDA